MSLILNGKTITIAEYAALIIEAARKIIERERNDMDANTQDTSLTGASEEGTPVDAHTSEAAAPAPENEQNQIKSASQDMSSVMLRLPDGTLKTVEEYIMNIIKDASSLIEKETTTASVQKEFTKGDNSESKPADDVSQNATADDSIISAASEDVDASKKSKTNKAKRTSSISKVFHRLFNRGKSKEVPQKEENVASNEEATSNKESSLEKEDNKALEIAETPVCENLEQIIEPEKTEETQSAEQIAEKEGKKEIPNDNKEIPPRKQRKKRNSFRKMLSCFSSKSAQVD